MQVRINNSLVKNADGAANIYVNISDSAKMKLTNMWKPRPSRLSNSW